MELYFGNQKLGSISSVRTEGVWINGELEYQSLDESYRSFFEYMVDEKNTFEEPPFPPELLDEYNWYIIDETGKKAGISIPAVYPDGYITWRWQ